MGSHAKHIRYEGSSRSLKIASGVVWRRRYIRPQSIAFMTLAVLLLVFSTGQRLSRGDSFSPGSAMAATPVDRPFVLAGMTPGELDRESRMVRDVMRQDTGSLMDMMDVDLRLALGDPGLRRQEGDVQVWQYRSSQCILDVYLTDPAAVQGALNPNYAHVVHYDVRSRVKAALVPVSVAQDIPADEGQCLQSLMDVHRGNEFTTAQTG